MSDISIGLVEGLLRTTLWLALAAALAVAALRLTRPSRPTVHRTAWLLVLLVGWTFLRLPVAVPWYEAPAVELAHHEPPQDLMPSQVDPAEVEAWALLLEGPTQPMDELMPLTPAVAPSEWSEPAPVVPVHEMPTASAAPPLAREPEPVAASQAGWRLSWQKSVLIVWLTGVALLAGVWAVGYARFVRALRKRSPASDSWQSEWREVLAAAGVRRSIALSTLGQLGPMLCRLPRGYELIVPAGLWHELDAAGRRAILRHELAHYQRGDVWKSLAARMLALPHWFNPLAWLAVRHFDDAAEWACDRAATAAEPATEYAKALVRLGQLPTSYGYGSAARGRTLAARIRRILSGEPAKDSTLKEGLLLAAAITLAAASVLHVELVAHEPAGEKAKPADDGAVLDVVAQDDQPASAGDKTDEGAPQTDPPAQKTPQASPALDDMVTQAKLAYEGYYQDYLAEKVLMPAVYEWSTRWMMAAENAAANKQERIRAIKAHIKRMERLREGIQRMFNMEVRGGEFSKLAAAKFYVAEGERRLELAEAQADTVQSTATSVAGLAHVLDLKIKLAELRGDREETSAMLAIAKHKLDRFNRIRESQPGAVTVDQLHTAQAETVGLEARVKALQEQIELYEQLLKMATEGQAEAGRSPAKNPANNTQIVELKANLIELRGEQEKTIASLDIAKRKLARVRQFVIRNPQTNDLGELDAAEAEVTQLLVSAKTLKEQIAQYEQLLKLATEGQQPAEAELKGAASAAPKPASTDDTTAKSASELDEKLSALRAEHLIEETQLRTVTSVMSRAELPREDHDKIDAMYKRMRDKIDALNQQIEAAEAERAALGAREEPAAASDKPRHAPTYEFSGSGTLKMGPNSSCQLKGNGAIAKAQNSNPEMLEVTLLPGGQVHLRSKTIAGSTQVTLSNDKGEAQTIDVVVGDLLYDGKSFAEWADILREDLSPSRRVEAMKAVATFGANGRGADAAALILDVIGGYSVWTIDNSAEGQLKQEALAAFGYPSGGDAPALPRQDVLPLVEQALQSSNANQRLFAAMVLPTLETDEMKLAPLMAPLVADSSDVVRSTAVPWLLAHAPATPGLVDVLRDALRSDDRSMMQWAVFTISGNSKVEQLAQLAPDLVALLDRDWYVLGGRGGGAAEPMPQSVLVQMGPAAIPALEEALKSDNPKVRERAQAVLNQIRHGQPKDEAKPDQPLKERKEPAAPSPEDPFEPSSD